MRKKLINSQLSNVKTYQMYLRQMTTLACNVFKFDNLPEFIDEGYINRVLLEQGSIAWFYDEVLGLIALPYTIYGTPDIYGRPISIMARAQNGQFFRQLKRDDFVIMYDNTSYLTIYADICQMAERISLNVRTEDINTVQQRTPRIWYTNKNKERSLRDALNSLDGLEEKIVTYDGIDLGQMNSVLAPAPYLLDKLDDHIATLWAEFYRLIGVANLTTSKRERMITDEVRASMGGAIASRYSRLTPRERAIDEINNKWKDKLKAPLSVHYYDGLTPDSDNEILESEDDINVDTTPISL